MTQDVISTTHPLPVYWITEDGYYMSFPIEAGISAQAKSATPCSFEGHRELAGCIAIEDADNAGMVWLGYSDVQWTRAVIDAHKGAKGKPLRQLHMRQFDAQTWAKTHRTSPGQLASAGRGTTPHAVPMSELANTISEYVPNRPAQPPAFAPLSAPNYRLHAGKADSTLAACSRRSAQLSGAIVVLDDPAGMAQDLAGLIHWHQEHLLDTRVPQGKYGGGYGNYATTYRNLLALDGSIKTLHASNDEKVKMQVFADAAALADYMKVSYELAREQRKPGEPKLPNPADLARQRQLDGALRNPSPASIQAKQDESWKEYFARLKPAPYLTWADEFRAAADQLRNQHIEALARAHVAWMQSNLLANTLDCTHDGRDVLSGDVYAQLIAASLGAEWSGMGDALFVRPVAQATQIVLQPAQASLNDAWRQSIVANWNKSFAGRYPFDNTDNDASIPELARFIRPQGGLVSAFLSAQLAGVLELQGDQWVEVNTRGGALQFDPAFLKAVNTLQRVAGHLMAQGEPQYRFDLKPIPTPGITDTILTIDSQKLHYFNQRERWQALMWPSNDTQSVGTRLQWQTETAGTSKNFEFAGRWALIRMLERAKVEPIDNATFQLTWQAAPDTRVVQISTPVTAPKSIHNVSDDWTGSNNDSLDSLVTQQPLTAASPKLDYPLSYLMRTDVGKGPLELLALKGFTLPSRMFIERARTAVPNTANPPPLPQAAREAARHAATPLPDVTVGLVQ